MPVKTSASFRMTALPMVVTAQLLAAAVLALTLVWVLHFRGGVSLNRRSNLFVYTVISHALHRIFLNSRSNNMRTLLSLSGTPSVHGDRLYHLHRRR
jgi:hypothetical protein